MLLTLYVLIAVVAGVLGGALIARQIVRAEVRELRGLLEQCRLAVVESTAVAPAPPPPPVVVVAPPPAVVAPPAPEPAISAEVTPAILMVLTAAVAAFLGKRAKIRSARAAPVEHGSAWAQQGRVFVQASHNLPR